MRSVDEVVEALRRAGAGRGASIGLALGDVGVGLALDSSTELAVDGDPGEVITAVEDELRPRWITWSPATARGLVAAGVRVATCWDIVTVERLLLGRWRLDPASAWAAARNLPFDGLPSEQPFDLFHQDDDGDPDEPVRADGYLRPDWVGGAALTTPERLARWAALAVDVAAVQHARLAGDDRASTTARSESTAELLCAELEVDGLPLDRDEAERIVASFVGPRPRDEHEAAAQRAERDAAVLAHAPPGSRFDLRSPNDVRSLLRRIGIEVPDTRAWRLESMADTHPLLPALLAWRKAERMATAFGYSWLDANLGADGRLRGEWSGSDGAAGRMTASAGLHNMPAELRPAVRAEPGHVFVRADLGQIEPRVLAAVSGDPALAAATADADMYAPVARQLGVERALAKVAVLGAMYGQTTGRGAETLRSLERAYPVAMACLTDAAHAAAAGQDVRTFGGRRVRMGSDAGFDLDEREARSRAAARGRYGRNAIIQGAAAELFKMWALLVRAEGAGVVLCLHDELLVHAPVDDAADVARLLDDALVRAAARWCPGTPVQFVADVSVVERWSDAK